MNNEVLNALKIVITTFICSAIIMPFMIKIAKHVGAIDRPRSDEDNRHIHTTATPFFGGLGIFLSFLLSYMLFGTPSIKMNSILIGSFIVILTGITDDIKPIKSWQKFIGHLIAASVITFYGDITLNNITAFGFNLDFGIFAYPITILFIVACTNIINLIDGLDGLSGGICSIFFLTIGIIGIYQGRGGSLVMILTFIMLGATLGFLLYNFHPAKIFAGDCSTFLGFIIAIISLLEFKGPALTSFFVPIAILAIPILDTLFAIIRRMLKGKPIFSADKQHLHHQLLGMNFSQTVTVLIIYVIDILFSIATVLFMIKDPKVGIVIYIILFILIIWFVFHTSIISDKNPERLQKLEQKLGMKKKKLEPNKSNEDNKRKKTTINKK
ncbi:MAG: undecaprenyl/decaprenyl-phosphate alpha-N-acetylglucosaminyl 1-phosphate transferase [Bacilli bacterium]|nr:undecaprenyl/decaprenyl-phosphate alpha-N-acetylglucosaminyl 1-phosphate transferase [Bacilli bacterium]